jgi:hypothetical protein
MKKALVIFLVSGLFSTVAMADANSGKYVCTETHNTAIDAIQIWLNQTCDTSLPFSISTTATDGAGRDQFACCIGKQ